MRAHSGRALFFGSVLALIFLGTACSKPLVHGRDREMEPLTREFSAPQTDVFEAAEQALKDLNYKVEYANKYEGVLRTGWKPTTADSHYIELFGREDYGTNASYYHLAVRVEKADGKTSVEVSAPVRGIVGKMKTSHRVESALLDEIADQLRPADVHPTNIGIVEKR